MRIQGAQAGLQLNKSSTRAPLDYTARIRLRRTPHVQARNKTQSRSRRLMLKITNMRFLSIQEKALF